MKTLLNNLWTHIGYEDDGHLVHTDKRTGKQKVSLETWPNVASAKEDRGQAALLPGLAWQTPRASPQQTTVGPGGTSAVVACGTVDKREIPEDQGSTGIHRSLINKVLGGQKPPTKSIINALQLEVVYLPKGREPPSAQAGKPYK